VSCATCHATERVDREAGMGAAALVMSDTTLHGPHDLAEGASPAHGTAASPPHFADGQTLCLACHDATKNPAGAAACTTGPEHGEVDEAGTCVSCHMPRVKGPSGAMSTRADHPSHEFMGPHHAWNHDDPSFLATAVGLSVQLAGGKAAVTLENQAGHAFPTGFPGRMAVVTLIGTDAAGSEVWTGPETMLNKVYVDEAGKPTPAAFAKELKADNRLKPGETRTWSVDVPAEVIAVEARVLFRLMPPPLAGKLGLAEAPEAEPRVITTAKTE
jgi:hypothetical protein